MGAVTKQMAKNYTKKGGHRSGKLWHDFQAEPLGQAGLLENKSAIPALVATIEDLPTLPKWDDVLDKLRRSNPAQRVRVADDLLWTIRFFKGQAWLQGEQLCVQPVALAQHFAPVIRALKAELVTILKEGEGLSQ